MAQPQGWPLPIKIDRLEAHWTARAGGATRPPRALEPMSHLPSTHGPTDRPRRPSSKRWSSSAVPRGGRLLGGYSAPNPRPPRPCASRPTCAVRARQVRARWHPQSEAGPASRGESSALHAESGAPQTQRKARTCQGAGSTRARAHRELSSEVDACSRAHPA